ncbi:MAG: hypothetical protein ACK5CH_11445, partial [Bacteroidota bacterium]
MINLRMIELYRLGIALLMLMFLAGRASSQGTMIDIDEISGTTNDDGFILCGASVTLTANPAGNTYLWSTMHTTQAINVNLGGTYTVTVTDASMATSTASVVITVTNDNTPPVAKCDTITVQLDASGEALVTLADVDDGSFDACSQVSLNVQDWFTAGANCASAVCVSDTMQFRSAVNGSDGAYQSNCPIGSSFESWAYFQVVTPGSIDMIIEATPPPGQVGYDAAVWGPFSSPDCSQLDLTTEQYCELDVSGGRRIMFTADIGYYMLMVTNPDNAAGFISLHDNKGSAVIQTCSSNNTTSTHNYRCADVGDNVVRLLVTDASGNTATCNAVVKVEDNTDPVILTCPPARTLPSCGELLPDMTLEVIAEDNCGYTVSQYPLPYINVGDFDGDTTIVTFTVTDASANTSSCTMVVTIDDLTAPTPICIDSITLNLGGTGMASFNVSQINVNSSDDCSLPQNLTFMLSNNMYTCSDTGTTNEALNVRDEGGNWASCIFTVTIRDATAPTISACPPNTTVNCTATIPDMLGQFTATDNCTSSSIVKTQSPAAGSTLVPPGPVTVTFTARDYSGNTSTCSALITVTDPAPPVFTSCPANITVNNDAGTCGYLYN